MLVRTWVLERVLYTQLLIALLTAGASDVSKQVVATSIHIVRKRLCWWHGRAAGVWD
jgi:hypothetical protein